MRILLAARTLQDRGKRKPPYLTSFLRCGRMSDGLFVLQHATGRLAYPDAKTTCNLITSSSSINVGGMGGFGLTTRANDSNEGCDSVYGRCSFWKRGPHSEQPNNPRAMMIVCLRRRNTPIMDFRSLFSGENDFNEHSFFMKDHSADDLPDLGSLFSVPSLPDNPQNPIMDSLKKIPPLPSPRIRTDALPPEPAVLASTHPDPLVDRPLGTYELWREASLSKHRPGVNIFVTATIFCI